MGAGKVYDGWAVLLAVISVAHVLLAPYTKVEESFNLQAVHDICHHGLDIAAYDHLEFPGVVPRTFLGALAVAIPACPVIKSLELAGCTKLTGLYVARLVLATFSLLGLLRLRYAIQQTLGRLVGNAFVLLTCTQFHLLFYAGRPLPNTFAFPLVSSAVAAWMLGQQVDSVIALLAFMTLVVRCDLLPLAALVGLHLLLTHQTSLQRALLVGGCAAAASLAASVAVDSFFWRRWLWPEGSVLWFNTAENRSSEWGTQPWHWYFTSALPRAMLGGLPLALLGLRIERRPWPYLGVVISYIGLYSLLPHKELRFLLPVLPVLNIPGAAALASLYHNSSKSRGRQLLLLGAIGMTAATVALNVLLVSISRLNYPGGHALLRLHALELSQGDAGTERSVHIDVLSAMTGVSRFGELKAPWRYSKEENLELASIQSRNFTHLLSGEGIVPGFDLLERIQGFSHLKIAKTPDSLIRVVQQRAWPLEIIQQDLIYIHKRTSVCH